MTAPHAASDAQVQEEFEALLQDLTPDLAWRARQFEPLHGKICDGLLLPLSAGVAALEPGMPGVDALLQRADAAMYAAKSQGRPRVQCWLRGLVARPAAAPLR